MMAPLISVPVVIEKGDLNRETCRYRYHLSYTGDEVAVNLSLKEKLRHDHGFDLPDFDENETTPNDYLPTRETDAHIHQAVATIKLRNYSPCKIAAVTSMSTRASSGRVSGYGYWIAVDVFYFALTI